MANIFYSNLAQDYGYENSGELVKIELIFKISGGADKTITAYLIQGDLYTPTEIWYVIKLAWDAYAWGFAAPILTIDHLNEVGTTVETISTITFQSMKIYYNENNPRSFELPMILGALDYMPTATGVYTLDLGNDFCFQFTGAAHTSTKKQLARFRLELKAQGLTDVMPVISSWMYAFSELRRFIELQPKGKKVIFLDELPWMDAPRSDFLSEFGW